MQTANRHVKRRAAGGEANRCGPVENSVEVPRKTNVDLPRDFAIPLLYTYPKTKKTLIQKGISTLVSTAAAFTTAKVWNSLSVHQETDKTVVSRRAAHTRTHSAAVKREILPLGTWTDPKGILLNEVSQRQTDTI